MTDRKDVADERRGQHLPDGGQGDGLNGVRRRAEKAEGERDALRAEVEQREQENKDQAIRLNLAEADVERLKAELLRPRHELHRQLADTIERYEAAEDEVKRLKLERTLVKRCCPECCEHCYDTANEALEIMAGAYKRGRDEADERLKRLVDGIKVLTERSNEVARAAGGSYVGRRWFLRFLGKTAPTSGRGRAVGEG